MEISIEKLDSAKDLKYYYSAFTVFIDNKRILTLYTEDHSIVKKWTSEVLKAQKSRSTPLIVGLSVDRENRYPYGKVSENANPFSIIQLCVGSHCLIYELPVSSIGYRSKDVLDDLSLEVPQSLRDFLSHPETICVGLEIENVAKKLEKVYGLKVEKCVEVRSLVEKGLGRGVSGDLDKLVKIELGKKMDVMRPKDVKWTEMRPGACYWWMTDFNREKAKFATVDAYLCYVIGSKYLITSKKTKVGGGYSSKKY